MKSKIINIVLHFFFKSNCNPNNKSFLAIPPKFLAMPSFEASSNVSKVASNSKSKHSNLVVQLVCSAGLPTFTPLTTFDMFEI